MKFDRSQRQFILLMAIFYSISIAVIYFAATTQTVETNALTNVRALIFVLLLPILVKYFLQLLVAPFYGLIERIRESKLPQVNKQPLVSVLIPAWNEEVGIIKTLRSVIDNYYENLEVIVINDGSTDRTHDLVMDFFESYQKNQFLKPKVKYLKLANGGKALALNRGLKISKGEIIVTVDADSVMDKNMISGMVRRFNEPGVGAVAGNVIVANKKRPLAIIQQLEYLYGFFFKRADSVFNSVYIIGGAAAAYRRTVLDKVGGFDHEIITEDIEMSTRILAHGYKTRYAADAVVFTEGPSDWQGLCNQRLRWKFGRLTTFLKHKRLFFSRAKQHNPYLSFLLLPLAVYSELTLLLEGPLLAIFYGYTILAADYFPLAFVILFMSGLISLQILCDTKSRFHLSLLPFAPIAWLVFYIIDCVEFQALCRSLKRLYKRQSLKWQKWVRVGVMN